MWVFLNNAMLSAVQHRSKPGFLMIRARLAGDLQRVFPRAKVQTTPGGDYRFRCVVKRATLEAAMVKAVRSIDYDNFKSSIHGEPDRSSAYMACWSAMLRAQDAQAFRMSGSASPARVHGAGSVWNQEDFWADDEAAFQRELRERLEDEDLLRGGLE